VVSIDQVPAVGRALAGEQATKSPSKSHAIVARAIVLITSLVGDDVPVSFIWVYLHIWQRVLKDRGSSLSVLG